MGDRGPSLIEKGVGGRPDIVVDTDALRRAAAAFESSGGAFGEQAAGFQPRARLGHTAFGSLPAAQEPYRQYVQSLAEAEGALGMVASLVRDIGAALRRSADNYDGADVASSA
jgi:hypothetical protein